MRKKDIEGLLDSFKGLRDYFKTKQEIDKFNEMLKEIKYQPRRLEIIRCNPYEIYRKT